MHKKRTNRAKAGKLTIYPPPATAQEVRERFVAESVGRPKDGENSYANDFLMLCDRVRAVTRSFGFTDYVRANNVTEIPIAELERLFNLFVEKLESWGVLDSVDGCYNEKVYIYR